MLTQGMVHETVKDWCSLFPEPPNEQIYHEWLSMVRVEPLSQMSQMLGAVSSLILNSWHDTLNLS